MLRPHSSTVHIVYKLIGCNLLPPRLIMLNRLPCGIRKEPNSKQVHTVRSQQLPKLQPVINHMHHMLLWIHLIHKLDNNQVHTQLQLAQRALNNQLHLLVEYFNMHQLLESSAILFVVLLLDIVGKDYLYDMCQSVLFVS